MAKKMGELKYFHIGNALGGSQDWMPDPWMKLGGCAALTAVDSLIYFALFRGKRGLCPVDVHHLTKDLYVRFAMVMKPYLRPRFAGVSKLHLYTEGLEAYLRDRKGRGPGMEPFSMGQPLLAAQQVLAEQIDQGMPVPVLLLNPVSQEWREYNWHWFLLIGYRRDKDRFLVKAVTYGAGEWLSFAGLWDEKNRENGGMILYHFPEEK